MASNRHLSRIAVIQALFAWEFRDSEENPAEAAEATLLYIVEQFYPKLSSVDFALSNLKGILKERKKIKEIIAEHALQWEFDKIAAIDRVILEQGIYEILFSKDVPPVVAINEAIEIAKEMSTENSPKFINGVLSNVMKQYKPPKPKKDDK